MACLTNVDRVGTPAGFAEPTCMPSTMTPRWVALPLEMHREIAGHVDVHGLKSLSLLDKFSRSRYEPELLYSVRVEAYHKADGIECEPEMAHESLEVDAVSVLYVSTSLALIFFTAAIGQQPGQSMQCWRPYTHPVSGRIGL